jgi:hypothetical protein
MRIAYLDCHSGISGDMMLGALLDLGAPLEPIIDVVQSMGIDACELTLETVTRNGFRAKKFRVQHPPQHECRHLSDILAMFEKSELTASQRQLAETMFQRLGEAEAHVHGMPVQKVHFHEVGAVDSIVDVVGTAIAWEWLDPDLVVASAVPVGNGTIEIAHGRVRLPAPATAELLKGVPIATTDIEAELTTPTGATFLATLVDRFGPIPEMTIEAIGCGAGDRDFKTQPNVLRILSGETADLDRGDLESIDVLETQVDDQPAEWLGFAMEQLFAVGALDVFFTPIQMKKNRPGTLISVFATPELADTIEAEIFKQTLTLGVRRTRTVRRKLPRVPQISQTPWGEILGKCVTLPGGRQRFVPEYESCRQLSVSSGIPIPEVYRAAIAGVSLPPDA